MLTNSPPSVSRLCRQCGSLDVPQTYGPLWPVTGIVSSLMFFAYTLNPPPPPQMSTYFEISSSGPRVVALEQAHRQADTEGTLVQF
jgi:hypothetical protein